MRKPDYKVAVVGATGVVGEELLRALADRAFPASRIAGYATEASLGRELHCGAIEVNLLPLEDSVEFSDTDLVFFAAGEEVSRKWAEKATRAGAVVIDTSTAWLERRDVPVVVPEVNARDLDELPPSRIVASPDPVAVALAVFLHPLRQRCAVRSVSATALDPVSVKGKRGVQVLEQEVHDLLNGREPEDNDLFPERVAFNAFPQVGELRSDGWSEAEFSSLRSLERVLGPDVPHVALTRVQVPLFYGTCLTVHCELEASEGLDDLAHHLRVSPGLLLEDEPLLCPSAADVVGSDATHVGRVRIVRQPPSLDAWVVLDNTRKGSAVNAVQIAELLLRQHL